MSGTVSQALKVHGPNFGVGGGPAGVAEALLTADARCSTGAALPGVWVVLTVSGSRPAARRGAATRGPAPTALRLALALVPLRGEAFRPSSACRRGTPSDEPALVGSTPGFELSQLSSLLQLLSRQVAVRIAELSHASTR